MSNLSQPRGILKKAGESTLSVGSNDKKLGRRESKVTLNEPKKGGIPENAIKEAKQIKAPGTKSAIIKREVPISEPGTISAPRYYLKKNKKRQIKNLSEVEGTTEISNSQNIMISDHDEPAILPSESDEKYKKEMELYNKNPDMYKKPEKVVRPVISYENPSSNQPKVEFMDLAQIENEIIAERARLDLMREDRIVQLLERQRELLFSLISEFNHKEKLKKRKKMKLLTRRIDEITKLVDNSGEAENLMDDIAGLLRGEKEGIMNDMVFRQENPLDFYADPYGGNNYGPGYNQDYLMGAQQNFQFPQNMMYNYYR